LETSIPIYEYQHPVTGEIFEDLRSIKNRKKFFIAPDGVKCPFAPFASNRAPAGWLAGREGFQIDSDFYKKTKPKYVRYRDNHRERYDPTRHT